MAEEPPLGVATVAVRFLFFYFRFFYFILFSFLLVFLLFFLFLRTRIRDLSCNFELRSMNIWFHLCLNFKVF